MSTPTNPEPNTAAEGASPRPGIPFDFDPSKPPSFVDVVKGIEAEEFKLANVTKSPCAVKGLLYGIGAGDDQSPGRALSAGNWGFMTFGVVSTISWEFCRYQRRVVQQQLDAMGAETRRRLEEERQKRLSG
ncbi:uncharacterized protein EV422DRAFT_570609 [Fimicolochytrium jonesii]|uniref:uncharacterized protein n=1 Tax=Fimicolochytrium jonesii TaxID=1396493 RepID=UPI0022FE9526|nr:uncharacterized protein EV422DRAFT_570609 [Fimicolochytrium jonesii]KAI8817562.1 hypothetical protein EV422DRAFT_570609 [Fimicolochytrium jonesii]